MLKKIFATLICFITFFAIKASAQPTEDADVRAFFDAFVSACNSYDSNVPSYFIPNANIYRVVIKPDGTKEKVTIPFARYSSEIKSSQVGAKLVGYKNRFENIHIISEGNHTYKLTTQRYANKDTKGLEAHYEIVKTEHGYKIKTESWDTTVQKFLDKK